MTVCFKLGVAEIKPPAVVSVPFHLAQLCTHFLLKLEMIICEM